MFKSVQAFPFFVQAFPMYGGLGMSTPSLHRESTDSLMIFTLVSLIFSSHKYGQDMLALYSACAIGAAGACAADVHYSACAISTKWRLRHPETPVEISVSLFDSFGEYIFGV